MHPNHSDSTRIRKDIFAQLSAEALAKRIDPDAIRSGDEYRARSICHGGDGRNLTFRDGVNGVLATCRSHGCNFSDIAAAVRGHVGDDASGPVTSPPHTQQPTDDNASSRTRKGVACFMMSKPATGTLVETYLRARGYSGPIPDSIKFQATGRFGGVDGDLPLMVALVQHGVTGSRLGCHRTALAPDGSGKAECHAPKRALGPIGGGAIRLGECQPGQTLVIGEGVETTLSAVELARMKGIDAVGWAAISAPGMRKLHLADEFQNITIAADRGAAGESAAKIAHDRFRSQGRTVRVVLPPDGYGDFNDFHQALIASKGGQS